MIQKLAFFCFLVLVSANSQTTTVDKPRSYRFRCDYHNMDVKGHLISRERYSGLYTRDLPGGAVRWTDVSAASAGGWSTNFGPPQKREFMEGFGYPSSAARDVTKPDFFSGFPPAAMQERSLVWDTVMFELFAGELPNLKPNTPHSAPKFAGDTALSDGGSFRHKDVQLTLSGTTKCNGQDCVVIDYRAFLNTLEIKFADLTLIGRSHYWGQIVVTAADNRIESGTLYEDVLGELCAKGQAPRTVNVFRIGTFELVRK